MPELRPTAMVAGGDAIARDADGRVTFVAGALPGERVRVEIDDSRRDFARGHVVEVLDPSPLRVAPPCPELARGCGSCQWQHITADGQRELKRDIVIDALRRVGRFDAPAVSATVPLPVTGYRTTVRAAVNGDGAAGYRTAGGHGVVDVGSCLVAHPLVAELLATGRFPGA